MGYRMLGRPAGIRGNNGLSSPPMLGPFLCPRLSRKRPDARRFPDDSRRAPQTKPLARTFGMAESYLSELRGRKPAWTYSVHRRNSVHRGKSFNRHERALEDCADAPGFAVQ
jgi:hypothetical protein